MDGRVFIGSVDNDYVQLSGDEMKTLTIALIAIIVSGCGSTEDRHRWMLEEIESDRIESVKKAELEEYARTGKVQRVERERERKAEERGVYRTPEELSAMGPRGSSSSLFITVMPIRSGNPYID